MTEEERKMSEFVTGWLEYVPEDALMPDAVRLPGETSMLSYEDRMIPMSVFECKDFGRKMGKQYMESIGEP